MDWGTIGASVLGSGVVGGSVSYLVANRESKDRHAALNLERDKWEHEKGAEHRKRATTVIVDALAQLDFLRSAIERLDDDWSSGRDGSSDSLETVADLLDASTTHSMALTFSGFGDTGAMFDNAFIAGADFASAWNDPDTKPDMENFAGAYLRALHLLHRDLKSL